MHRLLAAFCCIFFFSALFSTTLSAQWTGSGTSEDPYQITNRADLKAMADGITGTNTYAGQYFRLMNDIDMTDGYADGVDTKFVPIGGKGYNGYYFGGIFDGDSHVIRNLYVNRTGQTGAAGAAGLFANVQGGSAFYNLGLENVKVHSDPNSNMGALIAMHISSGDTIHVYNCYSTGVVSYTGTSGGNGLIGGLLGGNSSSNTARAGSIIDSCYSTCDVTGHSGQTGGLVGLYGGTISNSYATGTVVKAGANQGAGGLAGAAERVKNCYATGDVICPSSSLMTGGLIGSVSSSAAIENSYATGNVTTATGGQVGGLIGYAGGYNVKLTIKDCYATGDVNSAATGGQVGGLIGFLSCTNTGSSSVSNCYAAGRVIGVAQIGGLIGAASTSVNGFITDCYAVGQVLGSQNVGGFIGKSSGADSVYNCRATGSVTVTDSSTTLTAVGGFIGSMESTSKMECCYTTAAIDVNGIAAQYVGGFVGQMNGSSSSTCTLRDCYAVSDFTNATSAKSVGGFAGYLPKGGLTNCYSAGNLSAAGTTSGNFAGTVASGTSKTNCYYDNQTATLASATGSGNASGITAKTTAVMRDEATVDLLNYGRDVWCLTSLTFNRGYPTFVTSMTRRPVFNPVGDNYNTCVMLSLSCASPGAIIYYTLDGTDPNNTSAVYSTPIHINVKTTVKAYAEAAPLAPSAIVTETYTFDPDSLVYVDDEKTLAYTWSSTLDTYVAPSTFAPLPMTSVFGEPVTYSTFDSDIVTIDNATGAITVKKPGTVKITGTTSTGLSCSFGIRIEKATPTLAIDGANSVNVDKSEDYTLSDNLITCKAGYHWDFGNSVASVQSLGDGKARVIGLTGGTYNLTAYLDETVITKASTVTKQITIIPLPWGGKGTEDSPFELWTRADFDRLANEVNAGNPFTGRYFKVMNDIDMSAGYTTPDSKFISVGYFPNGGDRKFFAGHIDGDSRIISNLYMYDNRYLVAGVGLFGYVQNGTLKNINLRNIDINGTHHVGGLVAVIDGQITNCSVTGVLREAGGDGYSSTTLGGLVGMFLNSTDNHIDSCYADVQIFNPYVHIVDGPGSYSGLVGYAFSANISNCNVKIYARSKETVGGLIGRKMNAASYTNCHVIGDIEVAGSLLLDGKPTSYTGGLLGHGLNASAVTMDNCSFKGRIVGERYVGAIAAYAGRTTFTNVWAEAEVEGRAAVGGISGAAQMNSVMNNVWFRGTVKGSHDCVGGLVGLGAQLTAANCFAEADVVGNSYTGGLVGRLALPGHMTDCYSTGSVRGGYNVGGMFGTQEGANATRCYTMSDVVGDTENVGGFAGLFTTYSTTASSATDCYATGNVDATGVQDGGGFIGWGKLGKLENCYSAGLITGNPDSVGAFAGGFNGNISVLNSYYDIENAASFAAVVNADTTTITGLSTVEMQSFELVDSLNVVDSRGVWFASAAGFNKGYASFVEQLTRPVEFSLPGGDYRTCIEVVLSTKTSGAIIYYTLDGSEPDTMTSRVWPSGYPIHINGDTVVKAMAWKPGLLASDVSSERYAITSDDAFDYNGNNSVVAYTWSDTAKAYVAPMLSNLPMFSNRGDTIYYSTFDTDVIDIDAATGAITVKKSGTVKIAGETQNTLAKAVFGIKIEKAMPVLTIVGNTVPVTVGSATSYQLMDHGVATNLPMVWSNSNVNGAIVDIGGGNASVTAMKPGVFTLIATMGETEITKSGTASVELTFIRGETTLEIDDITVTYEPSLVVMLNATTNSPATVKYTTSSTGIRIDGNTVFVTSAGSYPIVAEVDTTASHPAAAKSFWLHVLPAQQILTFLPVSDVYFESGKRIPLYATSNNANAVITFTIVSGPGEIVDSVLVLPTEMTDTRIVIQASAAADINYNAAIAVQSVILLEFPTPQEQSISTAYVLGNKISMVPDSFRSTAPFSKKTKFAAAYKFVSPKGLAKMKKTPVRTVANQMDTHYSIEVKGKVLLLNKKNYNALRKTGKTTADILANHNDSGVVQADSIPVYVQHKLGKVMSADSVCIPALAPEIDSCYIEQFMDNTTMRDFLIVRLKHPSVTPKAWIEYRNPSNGKVAKMALPFCNSKKTATVLGLLGACKNYCPEGTHDVIVFKINPKFFSINGSADLVIDNKNGLHAINIKQN